MRACFSAVALYSGATVGVCWVELFPSKTPESVYISKKKYQQSSHRPSAKQLMGKISVFGMLTLLLNPILNSALLHRSSWENQVGSFQFEVRQPLKLLLGFDMQRLPSVCCCETWCCLFNSQMCWWGRCEWTRQYADPFSLTVWQLDSRSTWPRGCHAAL